MLPINHKKLKMILNCLIRREKAKNRRDMAVVDSSGGLEILEILTDCGFSDSSIIFMLLL